MTVNLRRALPGACLLLSVCLSAAAAPPDLTGIWTFQPNGGPALNGPGNFAETAPFTPEARTKIAEYRKLVDPTGDSPGAHCVQAGMPSALMLRRRLSDGIHPAARADHDHL